MVKLRELALSSAGKIVLHSMPGRKELWAEAKAALLQYEISHVLCLNDASEIDEKSPEYGQAIKQGGFVDHFIQLPVTDFSVPDDIQSYRRQIHAIALDVEKGAHLLIHCAAGVGRTGCAAMAVLQELGFSEHEAREKVLAAGSTPETAEQWAFIESYQTVN